MNAQDLFNKIAEEAIAYGYNSEINVMMELEKEAAGIAGGFTNALKGIGSAAKGMGSAIKGIGSMKPISAGAAIPKITPIKPLNMSPIAKVPTPSKPLSQYVQKNPISFSGR